jgi:hypothetical protein
MLAFMAVIAGHCHGWRDRVSCPAPAHKSTRVAGERDKLAGGLHAHAITRALRGADGGVITAAVAGWSTHDHA